MQLIAHTGTDLEISPGDIRTIALLKLHAGGSSEDGYLSAFNDTGQLSFGIGFTDGSEAIVVATVIPEPSTSCLVMVGGLCVALLRVRRMRFHRPQHRL